MEREANYLAVGTFVLLVLAMAVLFVYWYSASNKHGNYRHYEIYFDGSVSGLMTGSPVRYLGVDVGQVERISIDTRTADRVQVVVDIDPTTPVTPRTVAQLSLQGITGLMFVDLHRLAAGASAEALLSGVPSQHYPVIASEHSNLQVLLNSLPDMAARLTDLLDRGSRLLSDRNLTAADRITGELAQATEGLPQSMRSVDTLLAQLHGAVEHADQLLQTLNSAARPAGADIQATAQRLRVASDHLARASAQLDTFMTANGAQVSDLVRDGVPQLEGLLRDSRTAVQQIDALAASLREDPSRLMYQPSRSGVTIPP
jgi:phospholipid/cholesterol/gamma-HCH transport system substrate-binding protein